MSLTDDDKAHLRHVSLDLWERKMIEFIAEHGGEVTFNYNSVKPEVKRKIFGLCSKQLLAERPHEFRDNVVWLKLTDQGRAIMIVLDSLTVGKV